MYEDSPARYARPDVDDPEAALARVLAEVQQNVDRVAAAQQELDRQRSPDTPAPAR
jgi:hypothetical protein